jgi:hypothetical protein
MDLGLTDAGRDRRRGDDAPRRRRSADRAERTVLVDYLTDDGANPTLDLNDYDVRNTKLHGLFALVLQSPAYQVH